MGNHYSSPKSQTVYKDNCLPIQSDFLGCDNGSPKWGTVINIQCIKVLIGILFPTMGNCDQLQVLLKLLEYKFPTMRNHYPSPKSQTVYIDNCLPIQSDFSGCDNGSPQWGTETNFKFSLSCLNTSSPNWGTIIPAQKVRLYI